MVDRPARQVDDLLAGRGDLGRARPDRGRRRSRRCWRRRACRPTSAIPNGELSCSRKRRARLGNAVAVGVAQQRDAVGARDLGAGLAHHEPHGPASEAELLVRLRRRVALGDQDVAVRQHVQPARMIEPAGELVDREARRRRRGSALGPGVGRSNVHRRNPGGIRRRKRRVRSVALLDRNGGGLAGEGDPAVASGDDDQNRRSSRPEFACQPRSLECTAQRLSATSVARFYRRLRLRRADMGQAARSIAPARRCPASSRP